MRIRLIYMSANTKWRHYYFYKYIVNYSTCKIDNILMIDILTLSVMISTSFVRDGLL